MNASPRFFTALALAAFVGRGVQVEKRELRRGGHDETGHVRH